jgi:hypothetical protein
MASVDRLPLAVDREAWERQPGESERSHGYFQEFIKLGRARTVKKCAEKVERKASYLHNLCLRDRWQDRAAAFDRHMDRQWQFALFEHGRRMVQEHLKVGRALFSKATAALEMIEVADMTPDQIARFVDLYSKITRAALGEPETSVAVTGAHGGPIAITAVPESEADREEQMRAATMEIAARLGLAAVEMDPESILDMPE